MDICKNKSILCVFVKKIGDSKEPPIFELFIELICLCCLCE